MENYVDIISEGLKIKESEVYQVKGLDYLQMMNDIDDDLLSAASKVPAKKKTNYMMWTSLAAAMILIIGLGIMLLNINAGRIEGSKDLVAFEYSGVTYELADADSISQLAGGRKADIPKLANYPEETTEDILKVSEQELGSFIGTVTVTIGGDEREVSLYHYLTYPEDVCIADLGDGNYSLYIRKEL